jgi:hypothetical protein
LKKWRRRMENVRWVLTDGIFNCDVFEIAKEIEKQGMQYQIVDIKKEIIYGIGDTKIIFNEDYMVMTLGSIQGTSFWRKRFPRMRIFPETNNFNYSFIDKYFKEYSLNKNNIILSLNDLILKKEEIFLQFEGDELFIRPDSSRKEFAGQVFRKNEIENHFLSCFSHEDPFL